MQCLNGQQYTRASTNKSKIMQTHSIGGIME